MYSDRIFVWVIYFLAIHISSSKEDPYKQGYHPEIMLSDRIIKNSFIQSDDIRALRDYMILHPPQEIAPGWSILMLNSILNKEFCPSVDSEKRSEEASSQTNAFIEVLDKIKSYAETIAKEPLAYFIIAFGKRGGNTATTSQSYSKLGHLNFSLAPHADSCQLESVDETVYCLRKHTGLSSFHAMMDYTALVYLNALKPNSGGEFLFMDLPVNATITGDKTPDEIHTIQNDCVKTKRATTTRECSYLEREASMIKVTPAPGKFVLFESGPGNIHAVLDHTAMEGRRILTMYLTRVSKIDMKNFPPNDTSAYPFSFKTCSTSPPGQAQTGGGGGGHRGRRSTLSSYERFLSSLVY